MTFGLALLGFGMLLALAGVKGYSVKDLLVGKYGTVATAQSVAQ